MLFSSVNALSKRKEAELVAVPFFQKNKKPKAAFPLGSLEKAAALAIDAGDFKGKSGETALLYLKGEKEKRCLLVGLGREEDLDVEALRLAYSEVVKECQRKGITKINVVLPNVGDLRGLDVAGVLTGVAEGILLTNYNWENLETSDDEVVLLKHVTLVGIVPKYMSVVREIEHIAQGVYLARDLTNGNADLVTPQYLADTARRLSKQFPAIKTTVFDKKRIEKEEMGLFLAVARSSANPPRFIKMQYKGDPRSKEHTVLVGKGVTFDTGGLNLKPTGSMETMRDDMAGAATVISTLGTIAALKLKVNVTAIVAATENSIDAMSYKPGDVYKGLTGTTVEIGNTDAEGRLTLADALAYSVKRLAPTRMIDLATLTGAMVVALGGEVCGFFSNNDKLSDALENASHNTAENLWRLPLHESYRKQLKSDIADMKNVGGRAGGSITAALFLQEFVADIPWAHLDIAGTSWGNKERGYTPKYGVGFGVRLLVDMLKNQKK